MSEVRMVPVKIDPACAIVAHIPWAVAEKAYEEYSRRHGTSQTLERLWERGGLYSSELDLFFPEWKTQPGVTHV